MVSKLRHVRNCWFIITIIFKPTSTKPQARLDIQNYGCNGSLLCDHGVVERNCISSLESHGKALEKECCLPDVFCDSGDMPANLLCELNDHLILCTSCLYGKWVEDVCTGQFRVFVYLVLCCLVGCCTRLLVLDNLLNSAIEPDKFWWDMKMYLCPVFSIYTLCWLFGLSTHPQWTVHWRRYDSAKFVNIGDGPSVIMLCCVIF